MANETSDPRQGSKYPFKSFEPPVARRYRGEVSTSGSITAQRKYTSTSAPTVNNDGSDTAGLAQVFFVGDFWHDTTNDIWYECEDNSAGAASWKLINQNLGSKEVDETDLANGSFPWYNSSTGKFEYGVRYEDLKFPASRQRQGATQKPDFDFTNVGLLFPQNDAAEIAYMNAQFPHSRKNGSDIYPHIHWVQAQSDVATWKMAYRWYKNGADPTGSFTVLTGATHMFTYSSGSILQITSFPTIAGSAIDAVSSMMDIKLYREDNVVTGDVLLKEFDIHYILDTVGSQNEGSK